MRAAFVAWLRLRSLDQDEPVRSVLRSLATEVEAGDFKIEGRRLQPWREDLDADGKPFGVAERNVEDEDMPDLPQVAVWPVYASRATHVGYRWDVQRPEGGEYASGVEYAYEDAKSEADEAARRAGWSLPVRGPFGEIAGRYE